MLSVGALRLDYPLWYWVNDGLMTLFFFVIGLEVKRELIWGELRDRRNVALPLAGAVGGAVIPIGLFLLLAPADGSRSGWAIPMATDIAFVVGCLALFGARVPTGLKVLMLSLAIIDDILAVIVIAAFFTAEIQTTWLLGAAAGFAVIVAMNRAGVRAIGSYVVVGSAIWLCTLKSGIHPTVAGALLGLLTPASAFVSATSLSSVFERAGAALGPEASETERRDALDQIAFATAESASPLDRLERVLHPWVGFAIMPVFALANAGVQLDARALGQPIASAIGVGLVIGKPVGILAAMWLVGRITKIGLPPGVTWGIAAGGACLAGIGFTMALFVASLSLEGDLLGVAKAGILVGSGIAMLLGLGILWRSLPRLEVRASPAA